MGLYRLLRSAVSGTAPASLNEGELAINEADGKLFFRKSGVVTSFLLLTAGYMLNFGGVKGARLLTQSAYDALVSGGTMDPAVLYIIVG